MFKTILYILSDKTTRTFSGPDNQQLDYREACNLENSDVTIVGSYDITGQLILNIGLGDNPLSVAEIIKLANSEFGLRIMDKVCVSQWEGVPEEVLVIHYSNVDLWSFELTDSLRRIAVATSQVCVAAKYHDVGVVISQTAPDTIIFNDDYFVN